MTIAAALSSPIHLSVATAQTSEPAAVFADVLALTRRAVTSHWLVGRPEWTGSTASWERVAAEARGLTRCWPPLAEARGSIEQAHRLFERARRQGDDAHALFREHKRLLGEAEQRLAVAEQCSRIVREAPPPR